MKKHIISLLLVLVAIYGQAQFVNRDQYTIWTGRMGVGIAATTVPNAQSHLQLGDSATSKALWLPRVQTLSAITTPRQGMFVYNISDSSTYWRDLRVWRKVNGGNILQEKYYGNIYNQKGWTTLDTFIATSVTASVVSGRISLAGGSSATDFTHSLNLKYQTGLDRWKIIIKVIPTTKTASTFGIGIGTQSSSAWAGHGFDIVAKLDLSSGINSGIISLQNNNGSSYTSIATSAALSFSANDTLLFSIERKQDSLISIAQNLTAGGLVKANYQYITTAATNPMPNTGYFSLRSFGGTQLIDSINITSKAIKNAALVIGSDSKGFYFATAYKNVFANLVDHSLWSTNLNGGAAETTRDIIHRFHELQQLAPRQFILQTYANDLRSGMTQQESFDSITLIYNTLTSYGIDVLFLPLYETSENLLPWYQFLKTNWPDRVIESYQVLQTAGLLVDGTHFSTAGQDTVSKIIINSYKVLSGTNRYEQYNTLQVVTDAGNTTTNNIGINVLNPTIPLAVVNVSSAPAISGSISANTGTEVLKVENTNAGASAATAIRLYNNGGLNAQLTLGSSTNSVNPNGISFHSFTGAMRIGSNSDVFEIFTGVLGPSQSNVKARMLNDGRMAIGVNPNPATSALFDVSSTTLGFLTPRMTTTQQNAIASPANGLLIYNTDSAKHTYYNGTVWVYYNTGSGAVSSWNTTMAVSPDISNSYTSNFNSNTWQLQNLSQLAVYSDAGSTTRLKLSSSGSNLYSPDGVSGANLQDDDLMLKIAANTASVEISDNLITNIAGDIANTYSVLDLNLVGANLQALDVPNNKSANIAEAVNGTPIVRLQATSGSPSPSFDNRLDISDSIRLFGNALTIRNDTATWKPVTRNSVTGALSSSNWLGAGGGTTYTFSTGLTNTSSTITANLSTGVSGGQSVIGGTAANNLLTITGNNAASSNTATNPNIKFAVDNSSGTVAGQIHNNGIWALGTVANADANTHRLIIQQLNNTASDGIIIYPNANTGTYQMIGYGGLTTNASDYRITNSGGPIKLNSANGIYLGGTGTPNSVAYVNGSFAAAYIAKTATYSATISDYTIECTANTFTVTLPTAVGIAGRIYNIVNSGAGTITIATTSSQTFANVTATPTTLSMAAVGANTVQSNGANWLLISNR